VHGILDPDKKCNQFEIFGLDFMLDEDFKVYLIEVNTNPSLDHKCSPLLARLIPNMVEDALRLSVDPLFPPSQDNSLYRRSSPVSEICPPQRFELVYDD
jgi:hypothetical protein